MYHMEFMQILTMLQKQEINCLNKTTEMYVALEREMKR